MGLYPRKGVIAVGSDADIAIIDPEKRIEVDHRTMETNADWSPYQGWSLAGFAETTFCRGRKIVDGLPVRRRERLGPLAAARAGRLARWPSREQRVAIDRNRPACDR